MGKAGGVPITYLRHRIVQKWETTIQAAEPQNVAHSAFRLFIQGRRWTPFRKIGNIRGVKQTIVTLDMEGVLVPEIWIAVAEKTGIEKLRLTTRDIPDYDVLMKGRLKILAEHGLKLSDIQSVIGCLKPLDGGKEFLDELRAITQ